MAWQLYEAGFGYDFIGGFLFFDRLGSIMSIAQDKFDYSISPTAANRKELLVKKSRDGITAKISDDYFYLSQIEPRDFRQSFGVEIKKWLPIVADIISPSSYEKAKIILDYVWPVKSRDEVFVKLASLESPPFDCIEKESGFGKLMQNANFVFKSGATWVECGFFGRAFNVPTPSRQSLDFFNTTKQNELNAKSLFQKKTIAGVEYSWAVGLKISVIEETPPVPTRENDFSFERIARLMQIAENFHEYVKRLFKK